MHDLKDILPKSHCTVRCIEALLSKLSVWNGWTYVEKKSISNKERFQTNVCFSGNHIRTTLLNSNVQLNQMVKLYQLSYATALHN